MTTAIETRRRPGPFDILGPVARGFREIARRLQTARRRKAARGQLANLTDRLRQDIGLADSSPSAQELLERFYRSQWPLPREHESRLKLWTD